MPLWVGQALMGVGLLPLVAVAAQRPRLPSAWWWLAGAFAVSFVADVAGLFGAGMLASQTYPLLQAGIFALVLAPRPVAIAVIAALGFASGASLAAREAEGLDRMLHVGAWLSTAVLAHLNLAPSALRTTLTYGFAALALAWTWFTLAPTFVAWGAAQAVRVAMAVGFGWAAIEASRARRAACPSA